MAKSEIIDLYSPLSPEEIARKLKAIMDDPMPAAKARVYGSGSQHEMTLRHVRRNIRNDMAPALVATMEPYRNGTRITGAIGQTTVGRLFPCIWYGFLSIFIIVGIAVAVSVPDMWLFGAIFAGVPILMMVIGTIVFRAVGDGSMDRTEILDFLRRELDAKPIAGRRQGLP